MRCKNGCPLYCIVLHPRDVCRISVFGGVTNDQSYKCYTYTMNFLFEFDFLILATIDEQGHFKTFLFLLYVKNASFILKKTTTKTIIRSSKNVFCDFLFYFRRLLIESTFLYTLCAYSTHKCAAFKNNF